MFPVHLLDAEVPTKFVLQEETARRPSTSTMEASVVSQGTTDDSTIRNSSRERTGSLRSGEQRDGAILKYVPIKLTRKACPCPPRWQ